jgi:hypothetical protein
MRLFLALSVVACLLGGCGLPIAFQIASLAVDGIALTSTGKTTTDHAVSTVTSTDCALFRGLKGEDVCRSKPQELAARTGDH